MSSNHRLIEFAFPLKQTSIGSVHEKNVRHGHIPTLHILLMSSPMATHIADLVEVNFS
jgi:putative DNA methylase